MPEPRSRLPALFLGHGSPLNALQTNAWTRGWAALGGKLAAIAGLPAVLRDRARVQASRSVAPAAVASLMDRQWLAAKRREKAFMQSRR